jgi:hypothetical protein
MSRFLRHPIESIREPFGTAGLIVACVALVAALGGTAFAATKLNSTQKKEVEKIAKKFAGKPGAPGAPGTNGTNGTNGAKGGTGEQGPEGLEGEAGKSVVSTAFAGNAEPAGNPCHEQGGTSLEVEGSGVKHYACNGQTGFTEALPSEETETGTWALSEPAGTASSGKFFSVLSFPIPLAQTNPPKERLLDSSHVHYIGFEELFNGTVTPTVHLACPSEAAEITKIINGYPIIEPEAAPGNLCVYEGPSPSLEGGVATGIKTEGTEGSPSFSKKAKASIGPPSIGTFFQTGAGATGALITFEEEGTGEHWVTGTWAVTAP